MVAISLIKLNDGETMIDVTKDTLFPFCCNGDFLRNWNEVWTVVKDACKQLKNKLVGNAGTQVRYRLPTALEETMQILETVSKMDEASNIHQLSVQKDKVSPRSVASWTAKSMIRRATEHVSAGTMPGLDIPSTQSPQKEVVCFECQRKDQSLSVKVQTKRKGERA
ncbi:unnamed protein product [Timema podura]|uniref:Uncharacterized protein n=1 Tax=Timema podura TaxID=61482 RepID=A0ABN7NVF4_TIMPD|nr:unnamed protein product [Timema podura]